ncbi:MAG TPA: hypothetical protein VNN13_11125 [Methylomirabilota bacterium]|nr:hypothetical protein [Methylomirabilota bacterium]
MIKKVSLLFLIFSVGQLLLFPQRPADRAGSRTASSALSAGIDTLWLSHEDGYFQKIRQSDAVELSASSWFWLKHWNFKRREVPCA